MPINSKEISDEITAMEKENASEKPNRKNRKELWKTQSLKDSLYNDDGKGNKIPRASDIDQGSPSKLNYILKEHEIGDCFLLTNLMGLARKNPKFITNNLIKVKNDNEVEVCLYETDEPAIKFNGDTIEIKHKPKPGSKKSYSVKKDDAIKWKTSHKALWPVVIEIAYAKHLVNYQKKIIDMNLDAYINQLVDEQLKLFSPSIPGDRDSIRKEIIESFEGSSASEAYSRLASKNLRNVLYGGASALTLTHLTGKPSNQVSFKKFNEDLLNILEKFFVKSMDEKTKNKLKSFVGIDTSNIKKFPNKYPDSVLKIYNELQNKLKNNKIITASFKDTTPKKIDNSSIEFYVLRLIAAIKQGGSIVVTLNPTTFSKDKYEKWLKRHNLTLDKLEGQPNETLKKFVLETVNFTRLTNISKISKTKTGIGPEHAYLVLDALEHEGYKYIVLKNPHQMTTAINYKKSSKLPPEVKLPEQIDKVKNECMMELNHFYKKLASIDYDE